MAKHDENRDLRSVSRVARVDYSDRTIQASKSSTIGIHMWGKIDYLTKYCGWRFYWNNSVVTNFVQNDDATTTLKKKPKKEHELTDKTKKKK